MLLHLMRDTITGIILTAALAVLFSVLWPIHTALPSDGYGPQRPGDRGLVLPGSGDLPAEVSGASETERQEQTAAPEETRPQPTQTAQAVQTTTIHTGGNNMTELLTGILCGVAVVLTGEAAALVIVAIWQRIQTKHLRSSGVKEEHK